MHDSKRGPRDAVTGSWPVPDGHDGGETIVAPATAPGRGGIGVVRISGPAVRDMAAAILGAAPAARRASFSRFLDAEGQAIDAGIAILFAEPASFTGEDVLELQGHGGPAVMDLLVRRAIELGARLARPGEFSERAFLNDKIDLAQAEAVADLIGAGSAQAARAAMRSLEGEFSAEVTALVEVLTDLRVFVEAAIDFPDEDVEFLEGTEVAGRLTDIDARFARIAQAAGQGRLLRDGLNVVMAGRPNAGKSSLLNALAGYDAAIVTPIPGTTRDVLRERIHIDGLPVHVIDTAGLRETRDLIEGEGVRRARGEIARADLVLYVIDASTPPSSAALGAELSQLPAGVPVIQVWNKTDLLQEVSGTCLSPDGDRHVPDTDGTTQGDRGASGLSALYVSALSGRGLDELRRRIKQRAGYEQAGEGAWSARARHVDALRRAADNLARARQQLQRRTGFELVAEELRLAQRTLGEITGEVTSEDLLGRIFADFCIGK
jgi:tRNA modification GTPase